MKKPNKIPIKYLPQSKLKQYREENTPKECPIFKCEPTPVVDHCHETGLVRAVIDRDANQFLGKIESAFKRYGYRTDITLPSALRNAADFLEQPDQPVLHPRGAKVNAGRFGRMGKTHQDFALSELLREGRVTEEQINACGNSKDRTALYEKAIKSDKYYD